MRIDPSKTNIKDQESIDRKFDIYDIRNIPNPGSKIDEKNKTDKEKHLELSIDHIKPGLL